MRSYSQAFWTAEDSFPIVRSVLSVVLSLRQLQALFVEVEVRSLGKQTLIITGGQKAASSRNLADLSRRQPQSLANDHFSTMLSIPATRAFHLQASEQLLFLGGGGSSGCLSSFKNQMCAPRALLPAGIPPGMSSSKLEVISHIEKVRKLQGRVDSFDNRP